MNSHPCLDPCQLPLIRLILKCRRRRRHYHSNKYTLLLEQTDENFKIYTQTRQKKVLFFSLKKNEIKQKLSLAGSIIPVLSINAWQEILFLSPIKLSLVGGSSIPICYQPKFDMRKCYPRCQKY